MQSTKAARGCRRCTFGILNRSIDEAFFPIFFAQKETTDKNKIRSSEDIPSAVITSNENIQHLV